MSYDTVWLAMTEVIKIIDKYQDHHLTWDDPVSSPNPTMDMRTYLAELLKIFKDEPLMRNPELMEVVQSLS